MRCARCEADSPATSRFCSECGLAFGKQCSACGASHGPDARFCHQCGTTLALQPAVADPLNPSADGELKQVTVLFADIRGSTELIELLDAEAALHQLEPVTTLMANAVQQAGGVVNKRQGDGIMALFGVPNASEDHAVRACRAARGIIDAVGRLTKPDVAVRVGLASGSVVVRAFGTDATDFDAIGPTVHIAARLEQAAEPGSVLITEQTARLAHGVAHVRALPAIQVKGISEPIRTFVLLGITDRPSWDVRASTNALTKLVGRDTELMQMEAALRRASRGLGQALTLVGDAGLGKSRLVHEFVSKLPAESWTVLRASATQQASSAAFYLAADLLRAQAGVTPADDAAGIAAKLDHMSAALPGELAIDMAPLRWLLNLPILDPAWEALAADIRRSRLITAMCRVLLRRSQRQPTVVVIEDFHWVDTPSLELLAAAVASMGACPLLLLLTSRPERRPSWGKRSYATELELGPLEPASADAMLQELLGASVDLAALRAKILEKAEGTPLFLEEISRSLQESGSIVTERVRVVATQDANDIQIPASVQAILAARIDRLPPERRRLLQLASVVGKTVSRDLLATLSGLPTAALDAELFELQAAEFLYETNFAQGGEYTFKHALTLAVAYESMLKRQRRKLHGEVFRALVAMYSESIEQRVERLASHALAGEIWDAAASYSLMAAERANRNCAWREAVGFLEAGLAALSHLPQAPKTTRQAVNLRMELRVALAAMSDLGRLRTVLAEAHQLESLGGGDALRLARIDVSRCLNLSMVGELEEALVAGTAAYSAMPAIAEPGLVVSAGFALGQVHWFRGELGKATQVLSGGYRRALDQAFAPNAGTTGTASVLYLSCLMRNHAMAGNLAEARAVGDEAARIVQRIGRPFDIAEHGQAEGLLHLVAGHPEPAAKRLREALATARSSGSALLLPIIASVLGLALVATGALDEADTLLAEALAQTERHGYTAMRICCAPALGLVRTRHSIEWGRSTLLQDLALARAQGFRLVEAMILHLLGNLGGTDRVNGRSDIHRQADELATSIGADPARLASMLKSLVPAGR